MADTVANKKRTIHEWRKFDPFARPDWRWQLAGRVARGELSRVGLDTATEAAVAFRQAHELPDSGPDARHLGSLDDIAVAMQLYEAGGPPAWEVRARILTRQDDATIAVRCGVAADVVSLYGALFFDVRPHLDATAYLLRQVVGRGTTDGFRDHDVASFWVWGAISGGAVLLDLLVTTFHTAHSPDEPPALSTYLNTDIDVRLQAYVAAAVLPSSGPAAAVLMELRARLADAGSLGSDAIQDVQKDLVGLVRAYLLGEPLAAFLPRTAGGVAGTACKTDCRDVSLKSQSLHRLHPQHADQRTLAPVHTHLGRQTRT